MGTMQTNRPVFPPHQTPALQDHHHTPAYFRRQLITWRMGPLAMQTLLANPSCPDDVIAQMLQEADPQQVAALAKSVDVFQRRRIAVSEGCPPAVITSLLLNHNESLSVRRFAASNPRCPAWALTRAVDDPLQHHDMREEIAQNPNTPATTIAELARHQISIIAMAAVRHPRCGSGALIAAARHDSAAVRQAVASHPRCAAATLTQLLGDPDAGVRQAALANPQCPQEYRQLARLVQ